MRTARARSFAFVGCTFTIRLPQTCPRRIIAAVLSMLRTSLVAVPAFIRVEPAMTSGPVRGSMATWTACESSEPGVQLMPMVSAPNSRARATAPST